MKSMILISFVGNLILQLHELYYILETFGQIG